MPSFFQIEEAWIHWSVWNLSTSVAHRNCLGAFFHTSHSLLISCPFLILKLLQASQSPRIPSCCSVGVLDKPKSLFFFFFFLPCCAFSFLLCFPSGRDWFIVCALKGCQVNLLVLPAPLQCVASCAAIWLVGQEDLSLHCVPQLLFYQVKDEVCLNHLKAPVKTSSVIITCAEISFLRSCMKGCFCSWDYTPVLFQVMIANCWGESTSASLCTLWTGTRGQNWVRLISPCHQFHPDRVVSRSTREYLPEQESTAVSLSLQPHLSVQAQSSATIKRQVSSTRKPTYKALKRCKQNFLPGADCLVSGWCSSATSLWGCKRQNVREHLYDTELLDWEALWKCTFIQDKWALMWL